MLSRSGCLEWPFVSAGMSCSFFSRNWVLRLHSATSRRTSTEPSVLNPLSTSDVLKSVVPPFAVPLLCGVPPCPNSLCDVPIRESAPTKGHHAYHLHPSSTLVPDRLQFEHCTNAPPSRTLPHFPCFCSGCVVEHTILCITLVNGFHTTTELLDRVVSPTASA